MGQTWGKPKSSGEGRGGDILKLKDGESRLLHIVDMPPWETRTAFHSVLKTAITLPDDVKDFDGIQYKYGFVVYDFTDKTIKPWFVGVRNKDQILAYFSKGVLNSFDVELSRKGSEFNNTKYTLMFLPTTFKDDMVKDLPRPNMEKLCEASSAADIETFKNTKDPQLEERKRERDSKPASEKQRKFIENLIDKKKVPKKDWVSILEIMDLTLKNGETVPKEMNIGHATKVIDILKDYVAG